MNLRYNRRGASVHSFKTAREVKRVVMVNTTFQAETHGGNAAAKYGDEHTTWSNSASHRSQSTSSSSASVASQSSLCASCARYLSLSNNGRLNVMVTRSWSWGGK